MYASHIHHTNNIKSISKIPKGPDMSIKSVRECIHSLHTACRDIGFLGLKGHNISRDLRKETLAVSREFFAQPTAEKNKIHISKYQNCIGYQPLGLNVTQNKRDKHEGIDYYKPTHNALHEPFNIESFAWPQHPKSFESVFEEYISECLQLGQSIISAIALSLHLPYNFFDNKCNESFFVLRILHYPLNEDEQCDNDEFGEWGCGEHRDYGCLTFINCDNTTNCLEIRYKYECVKAMFAFLYYLKETQMEYLEK